MSNEDQLGISRIPIIGMKKFDDFKLNGEQPISESKDELEDYLNDLRI